MRNNIKWVVAIVFATLTAGATWLWTDSYQAQLTEARFLKLTDGVALTANTTVLKTGMIEEVALPERFAAALGIVGEPVSSRPALVGSRPLMDVPAGSLLLKQYFAPEQIRDLADLVPRDRRALSITVNAESTVGYFVRPGSRVDVIGTFAIPASGGDIGDPHEKLSTRVIAENVGILAAGAARNVPEYQRIAERGYGTVTLDVSPAQANNIILAQQQASGPLTLLLRGAAEGAQAEPTAAGEAVAKH